MPVSHAASAAGLAFWIHVSPGAKREAVGGVHGDALRVAVQAPPVEGRANTACVEALASAFGVKRAVVMLDPGARGRRKRVAIAGDAGALAAQLVVLAGES
jgi:uncharacterized protein (TIGR00251 family)